MRGKTHLIQLYVDHPEMAPRVISETHKSGVPIMCIVKPQCSCVWKLNVPNGMYALE